MAWPKGMPRVKAEPVMPDDSACLVYKDRAGVKLGGGPSEGASYLGTIANEARKGVEPEPAAE